MPLAYARRAGASAWTDEQREAFVDERKGQPRAATAGRAGGYHRTRPHTAPMPLTGDDWQTPTASHSQSLTPPRSSGSSPTAKAHKRSPTGTPCDGRRLRVQHTCSRLRLRRRAALCPTQPQALARGMRPPAGPRTRTLESRTRTSHVSNEPSEVAVLAPRCFRDSKRLLRRWTEKASTS